MSKFVTSELPPLRSVRLARGKGLRETARQAGIDPGYLCRIEKGKSRPSINILLKLAPVLGLVELEKLLRPYADGES